VRESERRQRPEGASVQRGLGVQGAQVVLGETSADDALRALCVLGGLDGLPEGTTSPAGASPP
jgi:hypothetical protein